MMWGKAGLVALVSALAACATQGPPPTGDGAAASVVGTPFLIAFKIPVCAATVVLGAPWAGVTGLSYEPRALEMRHDIDQGLVQNCGPPYVLPIP